MVLNNQVNSYKYLPRNNLTFANKIVRFAFLNLPKDRKKSTFKLISFKN
jgi:hypothetical protein